MQGDLSGRVAVVTGGGKGIGAAIARALARAGARVTVSGRDEQALAAVAAELPGGLAVRCDVTVPADVARLADCVHREAGPASIVVANSGIAKSAKFADTGEELWEETLAINLTGAYRVARAFWPDVLAAGKRGRVIFMASTAAKIGFAYTSAYCASKHGMLGLARALAVEVGAKGPTVNCVCPGWVGTEMAQRAVDRISASTGRSPAQAQAELAGMNPMKRMMTAAEVAEVTMFLASDAAGGVTGQAWNVDGGQVMA